MENGNRYYTGIGSRKTPEKILKIFAKLGEIYKEKYTLRSGGAPGADLSFEELISPTESTIFLPWKGFNNHPSTLFNQHPQAAIIASKHHAAWIYLAASVQKLMARNVHQVLGVSLDKPSEFIICWTEDGATKKEHITKKTGGTGLALSVACEYNIPIYNLGNPDILELFLNNYNLKEYYESI